MKTRTCTTILSAVSIVLLARTALACSTFCFAGDGGPVFGKNYDWDVADGMVVVNKRGVDKVAITADNPARWTSTYGSITFNQYGREMPCGGINQAGLVVELMWLDETRYPSADSRAALPNLQWVQYQLDVSGTVADVIASDADVRISHDGVARVHFLVADRTGACAAIEFLNGEMVVHAGETMPIGVLTNDTYEQSVAYLRRHGGFGGTEPAGVSTRSLDRFVRAATSISTFPSEEAGNGVDYAFDVLASVAQGSSTQWSIVYDIGAMRVYFRTSRRPAVRYFELERFDFSCDSPVRVLDLGADILGDASGSFKPYSLEANRELIDRSFAGTSFLQDVPAERRDALARYPDQTRCKR